MPPQWIQTKVQLKLQVDANIDIVYLRRSAYAPCTVVTICLKHAAEKDIDNTTHAYRQHLRYTVQWESTRVCAFTDNNRGLFTHSTLTVKRQAEGQVKGSGGMCEASSGNSPGVCHWNNTVVQI